MEMMKKTKYLMGAFLLSALVFAGCDNDDDDVATEDLSVETIIATGTSLETGEEIAVDLNQATSPDSVPPDATIVITFDREIDGTTANSSNFTLVEGTNTVNTTVSSSGSAVTIDPAEELTRGTDYTLTISSAVLAEDGGTFTSTTRTFKTAGRAPAVIPQEESLVLYIPFDNEVTDLQGHTIINNEVTLTEDRFGNFENAANFNGTTNYVGVEYGADLTSPSQTISYWIKVPTESEYTDHLGANYEQYVTFGLGGQQGFYHAWGRFDNGGVIQDYMQYFTNHNNSGGTDPEFIKRFDENKQEGREPAGDRTFEKDNLGWFQDNYGEWLHVLTTYDATQNKKSFYFNGELGTEFNYIPDENGNIAGNLSLDVSTIEADPNNNTNLYIGTALPFWAILSDSGLSPERGGQPYAFKGQMDEFRIFDVALTDAEVLELYNAERP